jgi:hypothetical protein
MDVGLQQSFSSGDVLRLKEKITLVDRVYHGLRTVGNRTIELLFEEGADTLAVDDFGRSPASIVKQAVHRIHLEPMDKTWSSDATERCSSLTEFY